MSSTSWLCSRLSTLPRRVKPCLPGMLVLMTSIWLTPKADAGFMSSVEYDLFILNASRAIDRLTNSVNTTPLTLQNQLLTVGPSGEGQIVTAFASVEPFPQGNATSISLRARATARQGLALPGLPPGGSTSAFARATWQDHISASWLPNEPRIEFDWGVVMRLDGALTVETAAAFGHQAVAAVTLESALAGSVVNVGSLFHQQGIGAGGTVHIHQTYDETLIVRTPSEDFFRPQGVDFVASLSVGALTGSGSIGGAGAVSNFGQTAQFLGFVALDAEGNILQGMNDRIRIQSDSGGQYGFLDALPVNAVPAPAGIVLFATGSVAFLVFQSRRLLTALSPSS